MPRLFFRCLLPLLLLLPFLTGCKEPLPDARDVDPNLAGAWAMDRDETQKQQRIMYREAGILKVNQDVFDFNRNFSSVHFNMDLNADASFSCTMGDYVQSGEFSGHWTSDENNKVKIVQTHEGKKRKQDVMNGHFDGERLHMTQQQDEYSIPWIFIRVDSGN